MLRPGLWKLLQGNRKTLDDTGTGNYFLNKTPVAQETRVRIDKWDSSTLECSVLFSDVRMTKLNLLILIICPGQTYRSM
jgi:hypothetical protein